MDGARANLPGCDRPVFKPLSNLSNLRVAAGGRRAIGSAWPDKRKWVLFWYALLSLHGIFMLLQKGFEQTRLSVIP